MALRLWTEFAHLPQSSEGEAYLAKETGDPYKPVKGEDIYRRGKTVGDIPEESATCLSVIPFERRSSFTLLPSSALSSIVSHLLGL